MPDEKDCEYDRGEEPLTRQEIQEMAHSYLANYGLVDKNHEFFETREVIGLPVESYITPEPISLKGLDGTVREYPAGTWIATTKITDPDEIQKALNGEYTGYSVTTISKKFADKQIQIPKRVLMKDIPDPVGFTISLVKNPCVKGAKFCNMKSDDGVVMNENIEKELENETQGFLQSIKGILNKKDENNDDGKNADTKDYVTKEDFEAFKNELRQDVDKSLETVTSTIKPVDEAVTHLNSTLDSIKSKEDEEDEEDDDTKNKGKTQEAGEPNDDGKPADNGESNNEGNVDEGNTPNVQSSKSIPNHDNGNATPRKKGTARVYEIMGRDSTGSAIRRQ